MWRSEAALLSIASPCQRPPIACTRAVAPLTTPLAASASPFAAAPASSCVGRSPHPTTIVLHRTPISFHASLQGKQLFVRPLASPLLASSPLFASSLFASPLALRWVASPRPHAPRAPTASSTARSSRLLMVLAFLYLLGLSSPSPKHLGTAAATTCLSVEDLVCVEGFTSVPLARWLVCGLTAALRSVVRRWPMALTTLRPAATSIRRASLEALVIIVAVAATPTIALTIAAATVATPAVAPTHPNQLITPVLVPCPRVCLRLGWRLGGRLDNLRLTLAHVREVLIAEQVVEALWLHPSLLTCHPGRVSLAGASSPRPLCLRILLLFLLFLHRFVHGGSGIRGRVLLPNSLLHAFIIPRVS